MIDLSIIRALFSKKLSKNNSIQQNIIADTQTIQMLIRKNTELRKENVNLRRDNEDLHEDNARLQRFLNNLLDNADAIITTTSINYNTQKPRNLTLEAAKSKMKLVSNRTK